MSNDALKTTQILILALIAGVALFAIVVAGMTLGGGSTTPGAPGSSASQSSSPTTFAVPVIALGFAAVALPVFFSGPIVAAARKGWESGERGEEARRAVAGQFQVLCIVRAAIPEGFGLFAIVAAMLTGEIAFLAGGAAAVVLMLVMFPTEGRWRDFCREVTGAEPTFAADQGETHDR